MTTLSKRKKNHRIVRVDDPLLKDLDELVEVSGVSEAEVLRICLRAGMRIQRPKLIALNARAAA